MAKLGSTADIAKWEGVCVRTVRRWIAEGKLRAHKTVGGAWRIDRDDLARARAEANRDELAVDAAAGDDGI